MFEIIGSLLVPVVLFYVSKQFTRRFFIELFLFLSFASLILGSLTVIISNPPEWLSLVQIIIAFLIYPLFRYFQYKKASINED